MESMNLADSFLVLPTKNLLYFYNFKKKVIIKPENYFLFTNSLRGDLEAYLSGCPQRFGMISPRKKKDLFDPYFYDPQIHAQIDPSIYHQTLVWEKMANRFGLRENVLKEPIHFEGTKRINSKIGIVWILK